MKISFREEVSKYGFKCVRCGKLVFDKEKNELIGTYEKKDLFQTVRMICCARCGHDVAIIVEGE